MNLIPNRNTIPRMPLLAALPFLPMTVCTQTTQHGTVYDVDHLLAYTTAVFLIGTIILLFYNFIYHYREEDAKVQSRNQNARLALVLQTGNLQLWIYDLRTRHYLLLSETGEYTKELNPVEFSQMFDRDGFEILRKEVFDICEGRLLHTSGKLKGAADAEGLHRYYEVDVTIAQRDKSGKVENLLCRLHDVTDEERRLNTVSNLLLRYKTVFNSALIDMLYYDGNGVLRDLNERACEAFTVPSREMAINGNFLLKNNPMYSGIEFDKMENTRTTSIVDFRDYGDERYRLDEFQLSGKMYYESTINPIRDKNGRLEGIYMAGRDVTEMVESFHRQQEGYRKLSRATKSIQEYINNINYALQVSGVLLVNYTPSSHTLEISDDVNTTQLRLSQLRCIRIGTPRFRRNISSALNRMDHLTDHPVTLTIETELRDKQQRQIWLMFNLVPMKDEEGHVVRYFGMCRNMTDLVETENRLAIETKKAQETELLKQSFLTNMSYEIRTPLNTVVGFAELFETEHDEADEPLFVEEIKRNSNSLLKLVNDILFLSRLDAKMIEFNKLDIDFALMFDGHCQMGWSSVKPEVKTIIENPYEHLVINVDSEHLGKVIEKLCANAVFYTEKGSVRAKYEYRHGMLTISVEDTGNGIDAELLPHIFDHFARNGNTQFAGTGLDLPIVYALVEQMGGTVEMQSEVGKGTTVWVSIPCVAQTIKMRRDVI